MPDMSTFNEIFTHTDPNLLPVLEELKRREPVFHTREFGISRADFEKATAPDYREASASGRRYSREFIPSELEKRPPWMRLLSGGYRHGRVLEKPEKSRGKQKLGQVTDTMKGASKAGGQHTQSVTVFEAFDNRRVRTYPGRRFTRVCGPESPPTERTTVDRPLWFRP